MATNRKVIASQGVPVGFYGREIPSPCYIPDFTADSELYAEFDGLNEISIAQDNAQYKDIFGIRLTPNQAPPSIFQGCSDDVILDNVLPKYVSDNDLFNIAHHYQDRIFEEQKNNE